MRSIAKSTISIEVIADDGISAGTMTGEFVGETLRIKNLNFDLKYLSANLLGEAFSAIVDEALSRGAEKITWLYNELAGKDYTDAKNDPIYLAVLPYMMFRSDLELKRSSKSSEYFINFSELPEKLWHFDDNTAEKSEAVGFEFLPVERLHEFYDQFDELIRSDSEAQSLSPLGREYDSEISCIMVMKGELVGWCLSREINEDIARISPVYVRKKFRTKKAGARIEVHVMNLLKKKYSGIRVIYDNEKNARLVRFYSFYFGKAFTRTARIFGIEICVKKT